MTEESVCVCVCVCVYVCVHILDDHGLFFSPKQGVDYLEHRKQLLTPYPNSSVLSEN
jgi:hypothetical protein